MDRKKGYDDICTTIDTIEAQINTIKEQLEKLRETFDSSSLSPMELPTKEPPAEHPPSPETTGDA